LAKPIMSASVALVMARFGGGILDETCCGKPGAYKGGDEEG